jgi:hypothetical protein
MMMRNILDIPLIGPIIRSTWTWRLSRLAMLALLFVMIAYGWHQHAIPGVDVRDPLMYTNFTTFSLWVVWLMGMVVVVLMLGRSWCTICPVGWLNGIVSRFGLRRELPEWLNNFVPVTLVLILLQLLVYLLAIHRFPDYSAVLLVWMLAFTLGLGLIFRRRAFCLLLCPAGAVFSLYARLAPWQLRVKSKEVCDGCHEKPCMATEPRWQEASLGEFRLNWRSRPEGCPVALVPAEIEDSADCTLCLNCVQTCCNDNVSLGTRAWPGDLRPDAGLRPSESFFFLVLLGLLTANFTKVYVDLRETVFALPQNLALAFGWESVGFYPLAVIWISLLFPLILLVPGLIVYMCGKIQVTQLEGEPRDVPVQPPKTFGPGHFLSLLGRMALPLLPVVLSAHLALAVVKLNAKLGFLPFVFQDPSGVKSFLAMNVMQTVSAPGALITLDLLKWLVASLLVIGFCLSLWAASLLSKKHTKVSKTFDKPFFAASVTTLLVLSSLYGTTVFQWLFVR